MGKRYRGRQGIMTRTNQSTSPKLGPTPSPLKNPPPPAPPPLRKRSPRPHRLPPSPNGSGQGQGGGGSGPPSAMADPKPRLGLLKHRSWSPDTERDEAWLRRKDLHRGRRGRPCRSVTDEDLDELRGCIDLGFGFELVDSPLGGRRLAQTFPALDLYYAIHRSYCDSVARSSPSNSSSSSADGSPMGSPDSIISPGTPSPTVPPSS